MFSVFEAILLYQAHKKKNLQKNKEDGAIKDLEASQTTTEATPSKGISFVKMLLVLRPYFWPHGFGHRVRALSTYLLLGTSKLLNLYAPMFMAQATNALVAKDAWRAFVGVTCYCVSIFISKTLEEVKSIVYLKVKQTAYVEIATMTYEHLHSLSLDWHLKKKLGDVLRSMDRGVESANSVVSYMFLYLLPTVLESAVVMIIFATHFQLAMMSYVSFLSLVIYAYVTITITLWRKKFRQQSTKHDNEYHDKATDALVNYETIKYFTNEKHEIDLYSTAIQKYQSFSVSVQASLSVLNISQSSIIQATILGCLALAIPHVVNQDGRGVDLGAFVAITVYLQNLFSPLYFLGSLYNMMINAIVDMQKLSELLNVDPDIIDAPDATKLVLDYEAHRNGICVEFQNVCFDYPEALVGSGLKDVSFVIPAGTTTALVGETGSGKTTISRLLFRFYDTTSGRVLIHNQNVSSLTQISLRKAIGIVPQDTVLFNDTILYNIKYGNLESTFEQVVEAAKKAKIYDFIMSMPLQWQTMVGERGLKLSGGEKQRVAIARTLLKDPPFVILDEATSALDTVTETEIQSALTKLQTNRTMLVIAHRLSTVRNASQIIVLGKGSVLESGTHEELMQINGGRYAQMWKAQLDSQEDSILNDA
ncbi:ATP-binding Cassette (ABC) Superfamily [Thraustotheca clavata]|uniref:ATP-binding Cassette (ABC) Superfamily n=1 Tax=Thraustotheca clavata TaxID=74557 RepID=A0A1V9ZNG9_9STRA|nr:ATP-binding Cassette (ABC) Superfamily [Thraustotheca clavata]